MSRKYTIITGKYHYEFDHARCYWEEDSDSPHGLYDTLEQANGIAWNLTHDEPYRFTQVAWGDTTIDDDGTEYITGDMNWDSSCFRATYNKYREDLKKSYVDCSPENMTYPIEKAYYVEGTHSLWKDGEGWKYTGNIIENYECAEEFLPELTDPEMYVGWYSEDDIRQVLRRKESGEDIEITINIHRLDESGDPPTEANLVDTDCMWEYDAVWEVFPELCEEIKSEDK